MPTDAVRLMHRVASSLLLLFLTCQGASAQSTPEDRAALFDYILQITLERESFSPVKNRALGLNVERNMMQLRDELIAADTEEKLYYALARLSNARKDRHLRIRLVEGGITLQDTAGVTQANYPVPGTPVQHAPIRFATDYGSAGGYSVFVADYARDIERHSGGIAPAYGDRLVGVNGASFADYVAAIEPYHRYSSVSGFWWQLATWIPQRSYQFPRSFYRETLELELEREGGDRYQLVLPYMAPDESDWTGHGEQHYPGFNLVFETPTFDLYRSVQPQAVLLKWHRFNQTLPDDIDHLMDYAVEHDLLDHAVIVDATRSGGGSLGAYAVQRLSPKSFKTTFGNLRISDAAVQFLEGRRQRAAERGFRSPRPGEIDDGSWLLDWLETDVVAAIEAGQRYSTNVPFKSAHAPAYSDGILEPAAVHFRGPLVCWLSPYGGSHLDQFASIVIDNELGHTMGMPAGGYSNTWEHYEVLTFPISGDPVVQFMWSIGHTIRPNGEILEGNPAMVDEFVPVTRENYGSYHEMLLGRTLERLGYW
jgi:hypothetical protein